MNGKDGGEIDVGSKIGKGAIDFGQIGHLDFIAAQGKT